MKYGKQRTFTWHVGDFKSSHMNPKVNDKFAKLYKENCGSDALGHAKVVRGKMHDYLGMIMGFTQEVSLEIYMKY